MKNNDFLFSGLGDFAKKASSTTAQPNVKPGPAPSPPAPMSEAAGGIIEQASSINAFLGVAFTFGILASITYFIASGDLKKLKAQFFGEKKNEKQASPQPKMGVLYDNTAKTA